MEATGNEELITYPSGNWQPIKRKECDFEGHPVRVVDGASRLFHNCLNYLLLFSRKLLSKERVREAFHNGMELNHDK